MGRKRKEDEKRKRKRKTGRKRGEKLGGDGIDRVNRGNGKPTTRDADHSEGWAKGFDCDAVALFDSIWACY